MRAYGFTNNALNLINDYLTKRIQRTKIGECFSTWKDIIFGVPQGSTLGALIFNIYLNDFVLFTLNFDVANYAEDNSPYEYGNSIDEVIEKLEIDAKLLIDWFDMNYLKPNPDKWHLLLSETGEEYNINIGNECITNCTCEKILGVYFENKMTFNPHVTKLCKKASQKLHALARVSNLVSFKQRKIIMNAFVSSQFNYCPLLWMCHSRVLHTQINRIHERALRIVYRDNLSSFEFLLEKSGSVKIHYRNLQLLAIEIYKALNNISSSLMSERFQIKNIDYNLRNTLLSRSVKTVRYGKESISYLAPQIWNLVPKDIKNSKNLVSFRNKIKLWIPVNCPCTLCKTYIKDVGYI